MLRVRAGRLPSCQWDEACLPSGHAWGKRRALARHGAGRIVISSSGCYAHHSHGCELRRTSGSSDAISEHSSPWLCRPEPESRDRWQPCARHGTWKQQPSSASRQSSLQWTVGIFSLAVCLGYTGPGISSSYYLFLERAHTRAAAQLTSSALPSIVLSLLSICNFYDRCKISRCS